MAYVLIVVVVVIKQLHRGLLRRFLILQIQQALLVIEFLLCDSFVASLMRVVICIDKVVVKAHRGWI